MLAHAEIGSLKKHKVIDIVAQQFYDPRTFLTTHASVATRA